MSNSVPYVLAALLDVIGYRGRLERDRETGRFEFKDALQRAVSALSEVNEAEYAYQAISDMIIVTCSRIDDILGLLRVLKSVQLSFLREGLLIRGGVAYERHFKSSNITYSHALALAYQIESSLAIYPRVVIDHNVIDMKRGNAGEWSQLTESNLVCVCNGVYFLNILDEDNWGGVYKWARNVYEADRESLVRREKEFMKHAWVEDYLFGSPFAKDNFERYMPTPTLLTREGTE